jgi:hypothetical protein
MVGGWSKSRRGVLGGGSVKVEMKMEKGVDGL